MSVLFISHSSSDNEIARELEERLAQQGHQSVFLDLDPEQGITAGQSWEQTLYTKLRACRAVLALCTDRYLQSHWCFAEIALARMEGKHIFTLLPEGLSDTGKLPSILREQQYVDLRTDKEDGYGRLWRGFKDKGIEATDAREWNPSDPPYPGLVAFQESDAPVFFGREQETDQGIERLSRIRRQGHPRFALTLGASGSGKSSLVRAGLLPRLRRNTDQWLVVDPFRPGLEPDRELAAVLSRAFEQAGHPVPWTTIHEQLRSALRQDGSDSAGTGDTEDASSEATRSEEETREFAEMVRELEARLPEGADPRLTRYLRLLREATEHPDSLEGREALATVGLDGNPITALATELRLWSGRTDARVLLVIDQFEELLGHGDPDHLDNAFLRMLREALDAEGSPIIVLATMRSDFLGSFQQNSALRGLGFQTLSLGPMPVESMRKVIEEPARLGAFKLEEGLTDRLLSDTGTSDALPLLAFTLRVMWDKFIDFETGDRLLEIKEYDLLGGLEGAVAKEADEVCAAALADGDEAELRRAFVRMVRINEDGGFARQPVAWEDISEGARAMLQHFLDHRLILKREDGTVEVAHEALFRKWGRLHRWLNASREVLLVQQDISSAATAWAKNERADDYLWTGGRLGRALELEEAGLLALGEDEGSFLHAARERESDRRRRRRMMFSAAALFLIGIAIGGLWLATVATRAKNRALEAEDVAQRRADELGELFGRDLIKDGLAPGLLNASEETLDLWEPFVFLQDHVFAVRRLYGDGGVVAVAHDQLLVDEIYMRYVLGWLVDEVEDVTILVATSHCEIETHGVAEALATSPFAIETIADLSQIGPGDFNRVLVVGNAWSPFTPEEIASVERFVDGGGALVVAGIGWSWDQLSDQPPFSTQWCNAHPTSEGKVAVSDVYPMNELMEPYGLFWPPDSPPPIQ